MPSPLELCLLFLTGFAASVLGSLVGLGGGFIVVPILRIAFATPPTSAAADSLVFVLANTASASYSFLRQRVVQVRSGLIVAAAGIPAGVAGALAVRHFSATSFDLVYGAFLLTLAIAVVLKRNAPEKPLELSNGVRLAAEIAAGLAVGFFSSLFGIGGGIVLVPVMLLLLRVPVHVVAGTSAFVVMLTSPAGIITHALAGDISLGITLPLVLGGLLGGNVGASLTRRFSSKRLSGLLAAMLFAAAGALALRHL